MLNCFRKQKYVMTFNLTTWHSHGTGISNIYSGTMRVHSSYMYNGMAVDDQLLPHSLQALPHICPRDIFLSFWWLYVLIHQDALTHHGLVTPYGDTEVDQHRFRWLLVAWRQAPSLYMSQCSFIRKVLWHSFVGIIMRRSPNFNQ